MGIISEKITQILKEADITRAIISKPSSKSSEYRKIEILAKEKASAGNDCKTCPPDRLFQISKYTEKQVFHENVKVKELPQRVEALRVEFYSSSAILYNRANFILRQYSSAVDSMALFKPLFPNQMMVYRLVRDSLLGTKYLGDSKWLSYNALDHLLKVTRDKAYYALPSQANQQILKLLLRDYKSFFEAVKVYGRNPGAFTGRSKMPGYMSQGSFKTAVLTNQICRIKDGYLKLPGTKDRLSLGSRILISQFYSNQQVYQQIQDFLEKIEYTGFANFDMKYDPRDGSYKLFEINLRQGRSSFYVTLNGYNLTRYLVADRINNEPFTETIYGKGSKLWLGVPKKVLLKYVNPSFKEEIRRFINSGNYGTTLFYSKDNSPKRYLLMKYAFHRYIGAFKTYFHK